jgi:hypothetical protein
MNPWNELVEDPQTYMPDPAPESLSEAEEDELRLFAQEDPVDRYKRDLEERGILAHEISGMRF